MLRFMRKAGPFRIYQNFYSNDIAPADFLRASVYFQAGLSRPAFGFFRKEFCTVVNRMDITEEEMFKGYSSTVRNEIRRSEREHVRFDTIDDVEEYRRFHNRFAHVKGTHLVGKALLEAYRQNLAITCARHDGKILAAHAYLCDPASSKVRLLYSSNIRLTEDFDVNFIGRANKFLHHRDFIHFKEKGFHVYDFGGFTKNTEDKQLQGINRFKLGFGGAVVEQMDYYSWLYRLSATLLRGFIRMSKHLPSMPLACAIFSRTRTVNGR